METAVLYLTQQLFEFLSTVGDDASVFLHNICVVCSFNINKFGMLTITKWWMVFG
jgi:hypothetical protein